MLAASVHDLASFTPLQAGGIENLLTLVNETLVIYAVALPDFKVRFQSAIVSPRA